MYVTRNEAGHIVGTFSNEQFDGQEFVGGAQLWIAPPTVQDQLNALDAANALTQRNLRETVMLMAEAFRQISGGAVDLSAIPGVAQVYAVEAEAEALRAQL
jgi:hypothetical protein